MTNRVLFGIQDQEKRTQHDSIFPITPQEAHHPPAWYPQALVSNHTKVVGLERKE